MKIESTHWVRGAVSKVIHIKNSADPIGRARCGVYSKNWTRMNVQMMPDVERYVCRRCQPDE